MAARIVLFGRRMVSFRRGGAAMVVSAERRDMNGVRNDIRSAAGLECGGGASGDEDGLASARRHSSPASAAAGGGTLAGSRPGFSQKKPEKCFRKYVSSYLKTTCVKNIFCYTVIRS